jgi:hypothetical protein
MNSRSIIDDAVIVEPNVDIYDNLYITSETDKTDITSI